MMWRRIARLLSSAAARSPSAAENPGRVTRSIATLLGALLISPAIQAKITIEIPDVTPDVANNVRTFLSLSRYAERADVTPEVMGRLQRRIVSEARRGLEPLGYYDPQVSYDSVHTGDDWKVTIHVTP